MTKDPTLWDEDQALDLVLSYVVPSGFEPPLPP